MPANYVKLTADTMGVLPREKQAEVYDFAKYLRASSKAVSANSRRRKKGSVLNLIGLGKSGVGDIALNHDKYLYDE